MSTVELQCNKEEQRVEVQIIWTSLERAWFPHKRIEHTMRVADIFMYDYFKPQLVGSLFISNSQIKSFFTFFIPLWLNVCYYISQLYIFW